MRRFALLYCLFATIAFTLFALAPAHAADGELDSTFGTDAELPGYGFYMDGLQGREIQHIVWQTTGAGWPSGAENRAARGLSGGSAPS